MHAGWAWSFDNLFVLLLSRGSSCAGGLCLVIVIVIIMTLRGFQDYFLLGRITVANNQLRQSSTLHYNLRHSSDVPSNWTAPHNILNQYVQHQGRPMTDFNCVATFRCFRALLFDITCFVLTNPIKKDETCRVSRDQGQSVLDSSFLCGTVIRAYASHEENVSYVVHWYCGWLRFF